MKTATFLALFGTAAVTTTAPLSAADFARDILPILTERCNNCHSTEKQKGDLDLERFSSVEEIKKHTGVWEHVLEQIHNGEMPPKDKPQMTPEELERLTTWVRGTLNEVALANAGDPGPVVLRRLSNAEYTYTVRDLTQVPSLDPAREFPVDGAAGEGFTNAGAALVMSPSLVTKYLDAAKDIASHAVFLPDGIRFSAGSSTRDQTDEALAKIRAFYNRFTTTGGGSAVNLQGIQFNTADGGVLPLEKYLAVTISHRDALRSGSADVEALAKENGLNTKYLGLLWTALNGTEPSLVLDPVRAHWRAAAGPAEAAALVAEIGAWQQSLWRFTQVGHIGKRDGPAAWQMPVTPLAAAKEVRLKLPPADASGAVTIHLVTSDAGDGAANDAAVWENARLVTPGLPDLLLSDIGPVVAKLTARRVDTFKQAAAALAAVSEWMSSDNPPPLETLAAKHAADPAAVRAWMACLGLNAGEAQTGPLITAKLEKADSYDFIKGYTGADALSIVANSSDQSVRIPGIMKPHGVAAHPSPTRRAVMGWSNSQITGAVRVSGAVKHAHPECGNGVSWTVELRRGTTRQRLAGGFASGAEEAKFGPVENVSIRPGDMISVDIGPRDGNHACDLTAVDLEITDGAKTWSLAGDVSPNILAGNPHPSGWSFFSEPDQGADTNPALPDGSLLARWLATPDAAERARLAESLQGLLLAGPETLEPTAPDAVLYQRLSSFRGPLLARFFNDPAPATAPATEGGGGNWGLDAPFTGTGVNVTAPSILTLRLPSDLAEGGEFIANAKLDPTTGAEGSVQMRALVTKPASATGLDIGKISTEGGKAKWSDGDLPVASDAPIVVNTGGAAEKRITAALEEFRQLFPAALCYTKIVPVDEVVTLTLHYREDDHFRRLLLDEKESAELEKLWSEFHYISRDALQLVDAFEQLYQFATQDADPSAFADMREPIKKGAEEFKALLESTRPAHVEGVLAFAENAWRRPLTDKDRDELRTLYQKLLSEEIPHENAIRLALARVLVAPSFLYRGEKASPDVRAAPVSDTELATRLSYFLWASAPDAELRAAAAAGNLTDPATLAAQARRMLRDDKTRRLAAEFGCQWLHIRDLDTLDEKSERHFPTFAALRADMLEESVRFFADLFQENRGVLALLDADYTFVSPALAAHYGLPAAAQGEGWKRVDGLRAAGRGGILGFASTLAKQSGASRTSPILRGNWLSEVVLGDKLPRPPKGVPILPEETPAGLTERQLTERHSSDPNCAGCHKRMDPFGFALEGFDAIGQKRDRDASGLVIDSRSTLADGQQLDGLEGLRAYLLGPRKNDFVNQFCRKLLGYALGRAVQLSDRPLVEAMAAKLESDGGKVGDAVEMIILSPQFRQVRGLGYPVE